MWTVYIISATHRRTTELSQAQNIRIMGMGLEHEDCLNVPQIPIISLSIERRNSGWRGGTQARARGLKRSKKWLTRF